MGLLNALADVAASSVGLQDFFVTRALWRLSVALCMGNVWMCGESVFTLASASGRAFLPGLLVTVAEYS
jgi:hypothetical protein